MARSSAHVVHGFARGAAVLSVALLAAALAGAQRLPPPSSGPTMQAPRRPANGPGLPVPPPPGTSAPPPAQPQSASAPPAAAPAPAPARTPSQQGVPMIIANTNLVNVSFSVQTHHGEFVPGLGRADFRVFEDGRPQQIRFFSAEQQLPLTLGWLIDTSPSQSRLLPEEQEVSREFFDAVIRSRDLAFVLGFDADTHLLQDLTSSRVLLAQAVEETHIGGGGGGGSMVNPGTFPIGAGGATHLWDAIIDACQDRLAQQVGRKAIVVITDGDDQGSTHTPREAARALLDANTVLYAVLAADPGFYGTFGYSGSGDLRHLATISGGRSFEVRPGKMQAAFTQIAAELRSQYTLAYRSDRPQRDGSYRKIKIELAGQHQGDKVRARQGYYADTP